MHEPLRVLHAPLNIANDAWCVSRAERAMGLESDVAVVAGNPYGFPADYDLSAPGVGPIRRNAAKLRFAWRARSRYDVLHYSFATSILDYRSIGLPLLDLRFARPATCVVMTLHGCDVRPLRPGGCHICGGSCEADPVRARLAIIRRHADLICVKTPDLLQYVPDAVHVPQAAQVSEVNPATWTSNGPLCVVHAPTSRVAKGTEALLSAHSRLLREGYDIDLMLIENQSHTDSLAAYARADVGVDQLRAGWYGVFSVELMALGKPVIACIDPGNTGRSADGTPPIINADVDTVYDALKRCVLQRSALGTIGLRSREYALRVHDSSSVAARVVGLYAEHCCDRTSLSEENDGQ